MFARYNHAGKAAAAFVDTPPGPALFPRFVAKERKSTPLFSCACARFCRYAGVGNRSIMLRSVELRTEAPGSLHRPRPLEGTRSAGVGFTCSPRNKMNTYAESAANPRGMRSYKTIALKAPWNEHLQKMGGGEGLLLP